MTLLELVQELWQESGSGGPRPTTIEATNGGELERLIGWIIRSDHEIQSLWTDWTFQWRQNSVTVNAGNTLIPFPAGIRQYDEKTFFLDDERIDVVDYLDVRYDYRDPERARPFQVVRMPDKTLRLDNTPEQSYTLKYDWYVQPNRIDRDDGNGALSIIPEEYQFAIVGRALMHYANYENAEELKPAATDMYNTWLMALEADYRPGKQELHKQSEGNLDMDIKVE